MTVTAKILFLSCLDVIVLMGFFVYIIVTATPFPNLPPCAIKTGQHIYYDFACASEEDAKKVVDFKEDCRIRDGILTVGTPCRGQTCELRLYSACKLPVLNFLKQSKWQ